MNNSDLTLYKKYVYVCTSLGINIRTRTKGNGPTIGIQKNTIGIHNWSHNWNTQLEYRIQNTSDSEMDTIPLVDIQKQLKINQNAPPRAPPQPSTSYSKPKQVSALNSKGRTSTDPPESPHSPKKSNSTNNKLKLNNRSRSLSKERSQKSQTADSNSIREFQSQQWY